MRVHDWKILFGGKENGLWWEPIVYPSAPYLFNLRMDAMERFDPLFREWGYMGRKLVAEKMWTLVPAQGIIAEHMKSLQEWPPRQRAESLSLQKSTEAVMRQLENNPGQVW